METAGMHHVSARRRVFTSLSPFPHPTGFRRFFDYLMLAVGTLAPLVLVPQVVAIYGARSAEGFALPTWLSLMLINILWMTYARLHTERTVFLANAGMCIMNGLIVLGIFLF